LGFHVNLIPIAGWQANQLQLESCRPTHDIPLHDSILFDPVGSYEPSRAAFAFPLLRLEHGFLRRSPDFNLFLFTFVLMDNLRSRLGPKTILAHRCRRDRVASRAEGIVVACLVFTWIRRLVRQHNTGRAQRGEGLNGIEGN
jgi:hypothetical protein